MQAPLLLGALDTFHFHFTESWKSVLHNDTARKAHKHAEVNKFYKNYACTLTELSTIQWPDMLEGDAAAI